MEHERKLEAQSLGVLCKKFEDMLAPSQSYYGIRFQFKLALGEMLDDASAYVRSISIIATVIDQVPS